MIILVIRTNHDIQTHYLYHWCDPILQEAANRGFETIKFEGSKINRKNIETILNKQKPDFVFFNGHGSISCFYDNHKNEFFGVSSVSLLKQSIVFARACDCLTSLGKTAIEQGCPAFIGYKKKFWVARQNEMESRPLLDPIAAPILKASNLVAEKLLKQKTVQEAVDASHEYSAKMIVDLIYSSEPSSSASLQALVVNDQALDFEGDGTATLRT